MRRYWKRLAMLATLGMLVVFAWWLSPDDLFFPQLQSAISANPVSLTVGENIHVSQPHAEFPFTECIIAEDPNRANRLFAASMFWPHRDSKSIVGYLSDDGGATWTTSLELVADRAKKEGLGDPTAVFGPNGDLYFVHIRQNEGGTTNDPKWVPGGLEEEGGACLDWLCLPNGAAGWETRARIDHHIDRPWLTVDQTNGRTRGRLYCIANVGAPYLITSGNDGRTFQFPEVRCPYGGVQPAQPVILSDSSLFTVFRWLRHRGNTQEHEYLRTFYSTDGGQSVAAGTVVGQWRHPTLKPYFVTTQGPTFPQLAVDRGSPRFADHLYVVWAQKFYNRRTTEWILFSRSTDRGKTWSAPVNLSEQPDTDNTAEDYLAYIPCIAVNKSGVIAVTWYDRRGLQPAASEDTMKGWNVRIRISQDGGATWVPSVQVTSQASSGKLTGWHTAGLAADAADHFHAVWIDDRTGRPQLWTARVVVK
jgi:hypothetical protein